MNEWKGSKFAEIIDLMILRYKKLNSTKYQFSFQDYTIKIDCGHLLFKLR